MQLSGEVAILSADGLSVVETRNLGSDPVAVKPGRVLPLVEIKPEGRLGNYADEISDDQVTRTWSVAVPEIGEYQAAIEAHVDAVARAKGYSSAVSCASYVNSANTVWQAEAEAFIAWRDATWVYAFAELASVQSGNRAVPTVDEFIAELPVIEWPEA